MRLIRLRLVALALALLAWQIAGVVVTPVALCSLSPARAGSKEDAACSCDHTGSAACPMHKAGTPHGAVPQSRQTRWCAGCDDQATLMILTMLSSSGGLPARHHRTIRPAATSERVVLVTAVLPDAVRSPVSPPPKGQGLSLN